MTTSSSNSTTRAVRCFISYSTKDNQAMDGWVHTFARKLTVALASKRPGSEVYWFEDTDRSVAGDWERYVPERIASCDIFVPIVGWDYLLAKSQALELELESIGERRDTNAAVVFPILIDEVLKELDKFSLPQHQWITKHNGHHFEYGQWLNDQGAPLVPVDLQKRLFKQLEQVAEAPSPTPDRPKQPATTAAISPAESALTLVYESVQARPPTTLPPSLAKAAYSSGHEPSPFDLEELAVLLDESNDAAVAEAWIKQFLLPR